MRCSPRGVQVSYFLPGGEAVRERKGDGAGRKPGKNGLDQFSPQLLRLEAQYVGPGTVQFADDTFQIRAQQSFRACFG